MSHKVNLVRVFTAATGTSTPITLGSAYSQLFMTPAEAGAMDGRVYTYLIVDGNDWEMGRGAYTASGTSLARTTIIASRIAGTLGTSRITLSGTAQVRFIEAAEDMDGVRGTRVVTGTSDVLANSDQGYVVTYSNASAIGVSLAQAGSSNLFLAGWATIIQNTGGGTVTITPATSTINGAATLTLATGMGALIWSDGTNYRAYFIPGSKPLLAVNHLSDVTAATARTNLDLIKQSALSDSTANRILTTGSFGLGGTPIILTGSDSAKAVRPTGFYYCSSSLDMPTANNGWLTVVNLNPTYCIFEYTDSATGTRYWGQTLNGVSSGWRVADGLSGTNATGKWTRTPGGWMVCTQRVTIVSPTWTTASWGAYCNAGTVSFPSAFSAAPTAFAQMIDGDVGSRSAYVPYITVSSSGVTGLYAASPATSPGTTSIVIDIISAGPV